MAKEKFFAVAVGPMPGIYFDYYENIKHMVNGVKNSPNPYKGFKTYSEAETWMKEIGASEFCVFRSLKEPTQFEYNPSEGMDSTSLPWDDTSTSQLSSSKMLQKEQDRRNMSEVEFTQPSSKINHHVSESKIHGPIDDERNKINKPDQSPITSKVREYARKNGFGHLSDDQLRAVQKEKGKSLLFAVPGSGKTTVIVARTGYLIYDCDIPPEKIMTLTFTKAAAEEMKTRYLKVFAKKTEREIPHFRTIHSFCYSVILKKLKNSSMKIPSHTIDDSITVMDDDDSGKSHKITIQKIMYNILKSNGVKQTEASDEQIQEKLLTYISSCKNRKLSEEQRDCTVYLSKTLSVSFKRMYNAYIEELKRYDCMDYDDMLILSYDGLMLEENASVLEELREKYTYWSVDEAQDNSLLQYDLMNLLAGDNGNLFMVGDDDQSIYGFRGAEPKALLLYGRNQNVVDMVMRTNYRSDSFIVESTRAFIEKSKDRADKQMIPCSHQKGIIRVWTAVPSVMDQYAYILQEAIRNARMNKDKPKEEWKSMAVLYRNNISGLAVMFLLKKYGIPFTASKSAGELLRGKPISLILNIIRFALQPANYRMYEKVKYSIDVNIKEEKKAEFERLRKQNSGLPILEIIKQVNPDQTHLDKIEVAQNALNAIHAMTSANAVKYIINSPMIGQTGGLGDRERIYALMSICMLYPKLEELIQAVSEISEKFHKETSEIEDEKDILTEIIDSQKYSNGDEISAKIVLSTAHKAKGQEFDHVIIIDAIEPPVISSPANALERADPEEERRLFYVALTRAKHILDILSVETYYGMNEMPSSYIGEFANICDEIAEQPVLMNEWTKIPAISEENISIPELQERTIYAVRRGFETGVFYTDAERRRAVDRFSKPEQKTCHSMQEALEYLYPDGIPAEMLPLNTKVLSGILYSTSATLINKKVDLPEWLGIALHGLTTASSFGFLSSKVQNELRSAISDLFKDDMETDYTGKVIPYAIGYLPVNVLKIWKPLWVMVQKHMLPHQISILEAGPGPGTAMVGLITFYCALAQDNPDANFNIIYHAVERQPDFIPVFSAMKEACLRSIPSNLHVEIYSPELSDAYAFMKSIKNPVYDLILESNMMNACEGLSGERVAAWLQGIENGLRQNGFVIQIEPGTFKDRDNLQRIAIALEPISQFYEQGQNAIDVTGFSFHKDAEEAKLRYAHKTEHWFNWLLIRRNKE